jgi:hypothetical protein
VQPALHPGGERVRGFLLLVFGAEGESVPAGLVAGWIRDYYASAEGAEPPYDPELERLLAAAERTDPIPLLPLAELARPEG